VEKAAPKECKEAVTKDTWKPVVSLEDGVEQVEEQAFLRQYVDCFAFSLHDLGVLKGQEVRINLTDDAPIYRKPYKRSEVECKMIQARTAELLGARLVELAPSDCHAIQKGYLWQLDREEDVWRLQKDQQIHQVKLLCHTDSGREF
jgi:hypothetical protein